MFKKIFTKSRGFTLLEILLVVGIIAILAAIVIIAINPGRQLAQVRNTERLSNLKQVYNAIQQYYIDNGSYPGLIPKTFTEICNTGANPSTTTSITGASCGELVNLSSLVPVYLVAIPVDPLGSPVASLFTKVAEAATVGTGYEVKEDSNKIALNALGSESGTSIGINMNYSLPLGSVWTDLGHTSYWASMSCTGRYCIAVESSPGGDIWRSTDSGLTWTALGYTQGWAAVTCEGAICIAGKATGNIWQSSDYGLTWNDTAVSGFWRTMACTGTNCIAANWGNKIKYSSNSGLNWTSVGVNNNWRAMACTGTVCLAGVAGGDIWRSTDSGFSWTDIGYNGNWYSMACTGTVCVAGDSGANIWRSTDSGLTWTDTGYSIGENYGMTCYGSTCVTGTFSNTGKLKYSTDSGLTWITTNYSGYWASMACTNNSCIAGKSSGPNSNIWQSSK